MRRASLTLPVGAALLLSLTAPATMAMGFGRTVTATTLGQPLNFLATVSLDADETLPRDCVAAEVLIGDSRLGPENVRATLEPTREAGERRVRVTTRSAVDEPVVTINVSVGCSSQMSRRFVVFVDPPLVNLASAQEALPPQRVDTRVGTLFELVQSADASRRGNEGQDVASRDLGTSDPGAKTQRRASGRRVAGSSPMRQPPLRVASAPASSRLIARTAIAAGASTTPARSVPRLRLEASSYLPPREVAAAEATPSTGTEAAVAQADARYLSAQSAADAASAALAREQGRILELENGLARLRAESQAQQKTLGALQARLHEAEDARYANGLVYALAGGMLFFALLAAAFYALRPRQRRRARWFDAAAGQKKARAHGNGRAEAVAAAHGEVAPSPAISQHPSQWGEGPRGIGQVTAPATIGGLEVTTVLAPQSHYARMAEAGASANTASASGSPHSSTPSMEELIDLEQQAEFFVVLGQEEAAIALLSAHLREAAGGSPLPYLQLLEIHQRREDREAYEGVREAFHQHFHAFAPEWSADLHFGRSLEEYPQMIARLQALWPTPLHAMQSLDAVLFRRSEGDETLDFPAYRDLLFLYSIARELAGQVETDFGSIDLFLPLEDTPAETHARHGAELSVDLDVSGWPNDMATKDMVIQRSVGRRRAS